MELHYADDVTAIGSVGKVFINVIRKPATVAMIRETRRHVQRHFRRWNNQSAAISIIEPSAAQSVPKEVRDESAALTTEFPSIASAVVIEGSGFRAAATRTAIAAMYLLARPPFPHRVFGKLHDGADWLVTIGSQKATLEASTADVVAAAEATRQALKS